jgi:signal transduction histidine kinase
VRSALLELGSVLHGLGTPAEDRALLPRRIRDAVGADWSAFRESNGAWIDADRGSSGDASDGERAARRVDFAAVSSLPREKLARLTGPALARSPRWAGALVREVLVYVEPGPEAPAGLAVLGLPEPLRFDVRELEALLRTWLALGVLRSRIRRTEEQDHRAEVGTRAACALHDLRHELTVSSLELDRIDAESPPDLHLQLERVRTAIAAARELCEGELAGAPPRDRPLQVAAWLRDEVRAARSAADRVGAVRLETRCDEGLAFSVDRRMLSRILRNLVLNAIEGSPDGERVLIEAALGSSSELVLRVSDRGRGMSAADREELSRFGRSGRGGWGIGSASVATCARMLGATRSIDSRPGSGTCVEIRVPRPPGGGPS